MAQKSMILPFVFFCVIPALLALQAALADGRLVDEFIEQERTNEAVKM